jgi:hypothetical protein
MFDAFVYMFFLGSGTALGVATIGFLSWFLVKKINQPKTKKNKNRKGGKVNGII